MEQELISIVVPVYRAERYIEETMDCVRAQTYPHWELLLVEDCGPDRSREIIEQYIQRTGDTRIRMLTYSANLGRREHVIWESTKQKAGIWPIWMQMTCGHRTSWKKSWLF